MSCPFCSNEPSNQAEVTEGGLGYYICPSGHQWGSRGMRCPKCNQNDTVYSRKVPTDPWKCKCFYCRYNWRKKE